MADTILWLACAGIVGGFLGALIVAHFAGLLRPRAEPPVAAEQELKCWYQAEEPTFPDKGRCNMWFKAGEKTLWYYSPTEDRWVNLSAILTYWCD